MLIPFSFDFVDSLCIATVLGFICEIGDMLILRQSRHVKVAVWDERGEAEGGHAEQAERVEQGSLNPAAKPSTQRNRRQSSATSAPPTEHGESLVATDGGAELFQEACAARISFSGLLMSMHSSQMSGRRRSASRRSVGSLQRQRSASETAGRTNPRPFGPHGIHWGIALAAILQLALSAISGKIQNESGT